MLARYLAPTLLALLTYVVGQCSSLGVVANNAVQLNNNNAILVSGAAGCTSGVRIFLARGANTPQDEPTWLNTLADMVAAATAGSTTYSLVYPAIYDGIEADYFASESTGANNLIAAIEESVQQCPEQKIVLIGYSEGAQVVGDTLIGSGDSRIQGLPAQYWKNIVGITLFGDPAHVPGFSVDVGTSTTSGSSPRSNTQKYVDNGFASNMQSYCDFGDPTCDAGSTNPNEAVHESYDTTYSAAAAAFLLTRINAAAI